MFYIEGDISQFHICQYCMIEHYTDLKYCPFQESVLNFVVSSIIALGLAFLFLLIVSYKLPHITIPVLTQLSCITCPFLIKVA